MIDVRCHDVNSLSKAALGEYKNDTVFINGFILNVFTKQFLPAHVYIYKNWISHVEYDVTKKIMDVETVVDLQGKLLCPAFIDAHTHIESSLLNPVNYARMVIPHGILTVMEDSHEIANVLGEKGLQYMIESAKDLPMHQFLTVPSCVPSVEGLETSGAYFDNELFEHWLDCESVSGLGEVMDYEGIIHGNTRITKIVEVGRKKHAYLQGHAPLVCGERLSAYLCTGISSDHECKNETEILEKYRNGMWIDIRDANTSRNMEKVIQTIKTIGNYDRVCFSSDDRRSNVTLKEGHMDGIVRHAVKCGMPVEEALISASFRAANEAKIESLGAIAPGYLADLIVLDDKQHLVVQDVYFEGKMIVKDNQLIQEFEEPPLIMENSIKIPDINIEDLKIKSNKPVEICNIVQYESYTSSITNLVTKELPVKNGYIDLSDNPDMKFAAVINRHGENKFTVAIVEKFGIDHGALASSVGHDAHNVTLVYDTAENGYKALQQLVNQQGGFCAVEDDNVIASLPLPIAGLMSNLKAEELVSYINSINDANKELGNTYIDNPMSRITILSLLVCPYVKISDCGIVLTEEKRIIPLIKEENESESNTKKCRTASIGIY